jgi:hypothetical protein
VAVREGAINPAECPGIVGTFASEVANVI